MKTNTFGKRTLALALAGLLVVPVAASASSATARERRSLVKRDANVVVAVVETAFNPYHDEFSRPGQVEHPSRYLPGYPTSAKALKLNLAEPDLDKAISSDAAEFDAVKPGHLYYIPGTNFVGAVYLPGNELDRGGKYPPEEHRPFMYSRFHGTGVTSVLGGKTTGSCSECNVVVIAADDQVQGLEWAASQPWIDIVSNSWGGQMSTPAGFAFTTPTRTPTETAEISRNLAASGKVIVWGSGNGLTGSGGIVPSPVPQHGFTFDGPYAGPPWVLAVGAAQTNGQPTTWHDIPVDVISHGEQWPRASDSHTKKKDLFLGTSCAAPVAAGTIASALLEVRRSVGDSGVGFRNGSLVVPAPGVKVGGPLQGGLTRAETVEAAKHAAAWAQPALPGTYVEQGYGLLNKDSIPGLTDILLGRKKPAPNPEVDAWSQQIHAIRTAIWGSEP